MLDPYTLMLGTIYQGSRLLGLVAGLGETSLWGGGRAGPGQAFIGQFETELTKPTIA